MPATGVSLKRYDEKGGGQDVMGVLANEYEKEDVSDCLSVCL